MSALTKKTYVNISYVKCDSMLHCVLGRFSSAHVLYYLPGRGWIIERKSQNQKYTHVFCRNETTKLHKKIFKLFWIHLVLQKSQGIRERRCRGNSRTGGPLSAEVFLFYALLNICRIKPRAHYCLKHLFHLPSTHPPVCDFIQQSIQHHSMAQNDESGFRRPRDDVTIEAPCITPTLREWVAARPEVRTGAMQFTSLATCKQRSYTLSVAQKSRPYRIHIY